MTATRTSGLRCTCSVATPIDGIAGALDSLWKRDAEGPGEIARSLTLNLVAAADAGHEADLRHAAERMMERSPARALTLVVDDSQGGPNAEVSAFARCQADHCDLVLEEIVIRFPNSWFRHVPGLLRPLLVGDLPTHLYWARDLSDAENLVALLSDCDHGIVDSRRFPTPALDLARLDELRNEGHRLTDLMWLRLRPWRRALAEAFERTAWKPGAEVTGVIRHGSCATAAAILLAHWLERRLSARIELEASDPGRSTFPEALALHFLGHDVELGREGERLAVKVTTPAQCHLPFYLPQSTSSDGDLLAAAIDIA